jgi:hypothetical protein
VSESESLKNAKSAKVARKTGHDGREGVQNGIPASLFFCGYLSRIFVQGTITGKT